MSRAESEVVAESSISRRAHRAMVILCGVFGLVCAPLVFVNNADQAMLTAAFIDGGSIVIGVRDVLAGEYSYNQNNGFHTSVYGWTYNATLIGTFATLTHVLRIDFVDQFHVYAAAAKCVSWLLSLLCVAGVYRLALKLFDSGKVAVAATITGICFASFIRYAYLIHPEPAGLAATLGMFLFLGRYLERVRTRDFFAATACSAAAMLSKQPFVFTLVPLVAGYFSAHLGRTTLREMLRTRSHLHTAAGAIGIGFAILMIVHPFAVLDFHRFLAAQKYMLGAHVAVGVPRSEIVTVWLANITAHWIVAVGFCVAVAFLLAKRFRGTARERLFSLIALYVVVFLLWLTSSVYPAGEPGYYYPVYPLLALLCFEGAVRLVGMVTVERGFGVRLVQRSLVGSLMIAMFAAVLLQAVKSVSYATNMLAMRHSDPFYVSDLLADLDRAGSSKILYSCTLPISQRDWKQAVNTFQVPGTLETLGDEPGFDVVALDLVREWEFETSLKNLDDVPRFPYVYDVPNRYEIYSWEVDKGNDLRAHWRQLAGGLRKLTGSRTDDVSREIGIKIFSREPITDLSRYRRTTTLSTVREPKSVDTRLR